MCGVCGIVVLGPEAVLPGPEVIRRMTATLAHRGPDDEGYHLDPGAALGHRRLSIIDRAGGHQPMANEDGSLHIVFNGEIYNHRQVRSLLEEKGHRYRTQSDTETLLHLMEEEGAPGLNRLNGMWAFAVWDRNRGRLLLARDRLGIKPLYYARSRGLLLFASEIKALLASGLISRELDPTSLAAYLECQYVPAPRTIFRDVKKLPPGHALSADSTGVSLERYWFPRFTPESVPSFPEAASRLRELLLDSVRLRLLSEVPLGAFLSGGIDSSLVVGLMGQLLDRPVKTFTVGFQGHGWYDESPEAEQVSRHFGSEQQTLRLESLDLADCLETAVTALDEPMADPASIPTYLLSRHARQWVTVALTGEGADEIFGGYDRYRFERLLARLGPLSPILGRCVRALPEGLLSPRLRKGMEAAALQEPDRHLRVRAILAPAEVDSLLLAPRAGRPRGTLEAIRDAADQYPTRDPVNFLLYLDLATWLHDDLLMKVDKMSMLASLEARVPFLDYRVVEFLFSLPGSYKIRGGRSKALLRAAFSDLLPSRTLRRRKHGFALPLQRWLQGELRTFVQDQFASDGDSFYAHLNRGAVNGILDQVYRRNLDRSLPLWVLLNLKVWCRQMLRPAAGARMGVL